MQKRKKSPIRGNQRRRRCSNHEGGEFKEREDNDKSIQALRVWQKKCTNETNAKRADNPLTELKKRGEEKKKLNAPIPQLSMTTVGQYRVRHGAGPPSGQGGPGQGKITQELRRLQKESFTKGPSSEQDRRDVWCNMAMVQQEDQWGEGETREGKYA